MEIPQSNLLIQNANRALARGRDPRALITAYMGILVAISAFVTTATYWLGQQVNTTGGLSQMGTRAIFSTAQSVLPILQSVLLLSLQMGYLHAIMRIGRGQYADHTDLKVGFQRFFPVLRMSVLMGLIYAGVGIAAFYFSIQIFTLTPWYDEFYTLMMPMIQSTTVLNPGYLMDQATLIQVVEAMIPMLVLYAVLYGALAIVLSYRFRMAYFALLDNPQAGAIAALRASTRLMRRNSIRLFKLDLRFWWYHLASFLCTLLCYGDVLLPMAGMELPMNATVAYFLFFGLYLAATFALSFFFRNRVELSVFMAYDAICPKPKDEGVVLGNIFDM